jgi:hypothetical protein
MGIEWYILCDDDRTAYGLGKYGDELAALIENGLRGPELRTAVEEDLRFRFRCTEPYYARVTSEIVTFCEKVVRATNDMREDFAVEHPGDPLDPEDHVGRTIYQLLGSRYSRPEELLDA